MSRDDIIRMAREAGFVDASFCRWSAYTDDLERFAALVAAFSARRGEPACPHIRSSGPADRATHWCALAATPSASPSDSKVIADLTLLERAAKAAGVQIFVTPDGIMRDGTGQHPISNAFSAPPWNPLSDDGDALRLAVELRLGTLFPTEIGRDRVDVKGHTESLALNDPLAATRRAIVRAAAAMAEPPK